MPPHNVAWHKIIILSPYLYIMTFKTLTHLSNLCYNGYLQFSAKPKPRSIMFLIDIISGNVCRTNYVMDSHAIKEKKN